MPLLQPYLWYLAIGAVVLAIAGICFRPIRAVLKGIGRVLLAGVSLVMCNVCGIPLGINLVTLCVITLLGVPGFCTLLAIHILL